MTAPRGVASAAALLALAMAGCSGEAPPPSRETRGAVLDVTAYGADPAPGNGDDAPAIRRAMADARPGDTVRLPPGVYDLESADPEEPEAHVVLRSGVSLRGAGSDDSVLRSSFDGEDDSAVVLGRAVENVVVADLAITSSYAGPLGTDTDDEDAGGGPMFGVYIGERDGRGSVDVQLEGLLVERFQRHGISVKASREVSVRDNEVRDATSVGPGGNGYGIAIEGRADQQDVDAPNDSRDNAVVGNRLDGRHLRHAILLQFPTHDNLVEANEVDGSLLDAIDLHGEGEYSNLIRGNVVRDSRRAGIALGNSGGTTHEHGASGADNVVADNVLIGNREGVVVILGTPDTVVEDNQIVVEERSEVGVLLDDAPGTVLRGNVVRDVTEADDFVPLVVDGDPRATLDEMTASP